MCSEYLEIGHDNFIQQPSKVATYSLKERTKQSKKTADGVDKVPSATAAYVTYLISHTDTIKLYRGVRLR
jgi:hypothetical protein